MSTAVQTGAIFRSPQLQGLQRITNDQKETLAQIAVNFGKSRAFNGTPSQSYGASLAICYLPPNPSECALLTHTDKLVLD